METVHDRVDLGLRRFFGTVALVTGGANGLGRGIARRFAAEGAIVWIADIDANVERAAAEIGAAHGAICDVRDAVAVDALVAEIVARHGRLDVMVANAGVAGGAPIVHLDDDTYHRVVATNLDGVFHACRAASRVMEPQRAGCIVTVSSVFGREGTPGSAAYSAAKAGVIGLTQSLARELAAAGVRVNCVSPGHMDTELYRAAIRRRASQAGKQPREIEAAELAQVPLGRFGTGDDVAGLVAFLVSDDAAYITGQTINVDGGLQLR